MKMVKLAVCLVAALALSLPAYGASFFDDNFNDGDVSDWTNTYVVGDSVMDSWHYGPQYKNVARYVDPVGDNDRWSEFQKPFDSDPSGADQLNLSFDITHAGGYKGLGGEGYKQGNMFFEVATGTDPAHDGWGLVAYYALAHDSAGQLEVGYSESGDWGGGQGTPAREFLLKAALPQVDDWLRHSVELTYNKLNGAVEVFYDGASLGSFNLLFQDNDHIQHLNEVRWNPHRPWDDEWGTPSTVLVDNIYVGDAANPAIKYDLVAGDANADQKVDIIDLTDLATNWGQTGKGWEEADFNFDWEVDILDLTDLATNWANDDTGPPDEVPEPATMALLGLAGVALLRKRS